MKSIIFEGKVYEVSDWVKFVARDSDDEIFGYEFKPKLTLGRDWFKVDDGRYMAISGYTTEWKYSLTEI